MPLSEKIQHIDEQIRATMERVVLDLRRELLERLQSQHQQLREGIEGLAVDLPDSLLQAADVDGIVEEAAGRTVAASRGQAFNEIRTALARIDEGRSQADILHALIEQAATFASRTAFLLAHPEQLSFWGGHGFGEDRGAPSELTLEAPGSSAWGRVLEGTGGVRLSSAERAELSSRLEVPVPQEAVLLPMVLRDRVGGALYADRLSDESPPLASAALQTLVYVAALALETLPLRQRASTPTLRWADEAEGEEGLPLWEPAATEAPAVEEEEAPVEEAPEAAAPAEAAAEVAEAVVEEPEVEAEEPEPAADALAPEPPTPEPTAELPEMELEVEEEAPPAAAEPGWQLEAEEPEAAEPEAAPPEAPAAAAPEVWAVEEEEEQEVVAEEAAEPAAEAAREDTRPGVMPPPTRPVGTAPPEAAPAAAKSPQVEPPSDVEGPGWAFTSPRSVDGDEALHEAAQRLARLLVSEIKLYNPEQVEQGRRNQDVYERLKEDIERSRRLYDERVEEKVREETDYFYDWMVRILADGDPKALGI